MTPMSGKFSISPMRIWKRVTDKPNRWFARQPRKGRIIAAGIAGTIAVGAMIPALWLAMNPLPDVKILEHYTPIEAVQIFDIHDKLAGVISGDEDRLAVKLSDVSPNMRKAMLAAEDHEFYSHGGFNPSSIVRAAMKNLKAGHVVEGASTITQQLVKNLFFPGEPRTFNRKIKEALLATQLDSKYSKDQILEMYLNQIYFGNQSYGIERAAQRYFNKPSAKLDLAEAAFLAGVVKAPSYLSNPAHRDDAIARQHEVLDKLAEYKMAPQAEVDKAKAEKLAFRKYVSPYQKYAFYVAYVADLLREKYGEEEMRRGMKVYTNLDPDAQQAGEKALQKGIDGAPAGVTQGALATVRINDGAVLALVGGVGPYEKNQWNRAVSPHTMGSSFKPFVYLTGFLHGKNPEDIIVDGPVSFPSGGTIWSPPNFEHSFMGPLTIKKALAYSRNVCAAKVAYDVGIQNVIQTARLCGITSKIEPYLPVCLGAAAASPLEMAGAYATFARGGVQMTPQVLRKIESNDGRLIAEFHAEPHKVFDSVATGKLLECMKEVVKSGTGILGRLPGREMAGKTGTSDASRDIWFCGFTADTATAAWGGNDHNTALHNKYITGGMIMSKIWKDYMTNFYAKHPTPALAFTAPAQNAPTVAIKGVPPLKGADTEIAKDEQKDKLASQQVDVKPAKKSPFVTKKIEQAAVVHTEAVHEAEKPAEVPTRYETPEEPKKQAPPMMSEINMQQHAEKAEPKAEPKADAGQQPSKPFGAEHMQVSDE
jgi:1A family penicillin-binding protein